MSTVVFPKLSLGGRGSELRACADIARDASRNDVLRLRSREEPRAGSGEGG